MAADQELFSAWRRGTHAQPVTPTPSQRTDSARRNPRTVIQQQRRGRPSRTSRGGGTLKRGVPTGSAWSRPDGKGTVGAGEVAGARAVTTARGGYARGTRGGVLARRADGRGAPPGPKP